MSDTDDVRARLIANESTKLTATYVNGVANAVLAIGGLAPLFSQNVSAPTMPNRPWLTSGISFLWLMRQQHPTLGCRKSSPGVAVMDIPTLTLLLYPLGALLLGLGTVWLARRAH